MLEVIFFWVMNQREWNGQRAEEVWGNNWIHIHSKFWSWILKRKGFVGELVVDERIISKWFLELEHIWNVMAHGQKPDFVFRRNGRVNLNWRGGQFSRLLAAEVCASAVVMVVMLDTPCSEVECKTTGYPLHSHVPPSLPFHASPCAIRFQLSYTNCDVWEWILHNEDRASGWH